MSPDRIQDLIKRMERIEERLTILENRVPEPGTSGSRIGKGDHRPPSPTVATLPKPSPNPNPRVPPDRNLSPSEGETENSAIPSGQSQERE
jgi:hypothetical protein